MLLLVILLFEGTLCEQIPQDELASFLNKVLSTSGRSLEKHRAIENINIGFSEVIFGLPVELLMQTRNATIAGPGVISSVATLQGDRSHSGFTFVQTSRLLLSAVEIHVPYLLFNIFGYILVTEAHFSMDYSWTSANMHYTKPALGEDCIATAVVPRPLGFYSISLGRQGDFLFTVAKLLTTFLQLVSPRYSAIVDHYFPDVSSDLEKEITNAICNK